MSAHPYPILGEELRAMQRDDERPLLWVRMLTEPGFLLLNAMTGQEAKLLDSPIPPVLSPFSHARRRKPP